MAAMKFMVKVDLGTIKPETAEALTFMHRVGLELSERGFVPEEHMKLTSTIVGSGDEMRIDEWRSVSGVMSVVADFKSDFFEPKL